MLKEYGWYALLLAMAGDLIFSLILPWFYSDYRITKMSISVLGNPQSPVRYVFNLWMLLEGLLFLVAVPAIYFYYESISKGLTRTLVVFVAIFAIGACILTCFFSVNATKDEVTLSSMIHGGGSVIGFMLLLFVPLIMGMLSMKKGEGAIEIISIICFILCLVFFVLFVMSDKPEFKNTFVENEGLWQRLTLLFTYLPLCSLCIKEIIQHR